MRKRSDQVLRHIINPAAKKCGYDTIRADQIQKPGMIGPQIVQHLVHDPMVIADLTGQNPNVFYELAVRHLSRKPVIIIIQAGETLPFDVAQLRTISFNYPDPDDIERCRYELTSYIRAAESDPTNFGLLMEAQSIVPTLERPRSRERRKPQMDEMDSYIGALSAMENEIKVRALVQLTGLSNSTAIESDGRLLSHLKTLFGDSSPEVRKAALEVYQRLSWILKSHQKKAYTLKLNSLAINLAIEAYDIETGRLALYGLVGLEDPRAIDAILKIVANSEKEYDEIIQDHIVGGLVDQGLGPKLRLQLFKLYRDTDDPMIRERISKFTRNKYLG